MKSVVLTAALIAITHVAPVSAQSVSVASPGSPTAVASANDYATQVMQDPWDMNQRTDFGWWLNARDEPLSGWASTGFSGGLFSGVVGSGASPDPNLWLLETGLPNVPAHGKVGPVYPINADKYRIFAIRMRLSRADEYMMFRWSTHSWYEPPGMQISNVIYTKAGWGIYFVDLATLGLILGNDPWTGTKRSLRFDPAPDNTTAGSSIDIDWIRLVEHQPHLSQAITWNGGGAVDIYLDNDTNPANDTLGLVAANVTGSFSLNAGALQPGRYYVAIRRASTNGALAYSAGYYQVNQPATIAITAPSEEGSADDYATVQLNNAWDMASTADVDAVYDVNGGPATVHSAETESGTPLGNVTAYVGVNRGETSTLGSGPCATFSKPSVYNLHPAVRGVYQRIDPTRYRILTAEVGLPNKPRDLCNGSIIRVVWKVASEAAESVSWGIPFNSRAGANVVSTINLDMTTLPVESISPSQAGWVPGSSPNPGIAGFRIDPHEFYDPTQFYIKRVKLAALETAHTAYTVQWTLSKIGGTVRVYYDVDKNPTNKTLVGSVAVSAVNGSLSWNTASLPQGAQYYVYVETDDGDNVNGTYSKWPVVIDHAPRPLARLVVNRTSLNFGITGGTIRSPNQTVRLTTVNGSPCWTASSDVPYVNVTPASGCGSTELTVALDNRVYSGMVDYRGYIRVTSAQATNSPQVIPTVARVRLGSTAPSGLVDTPSDNVSVTGPLAVTGWAVDDIGIARVAICRDPVAGENGAHPSCGTGEIYVGDAVSIEDARPDVESYSASTPLNYRAGWGSLVLTNMLPSQGNGTFVLQVYAFDVEGYRTHLGTRRILAHNADATEPFGTIDTPGQGQTISGGNYANFGWVLSRVRRADPPGGGHVMVFVDGVAVGSPAGWARRQDLVDAFPSHPGVTTALGVFTLNTLAYGNGLHTIAWTVTDVAGVTSGVGSRYFSVFNTGPGMTTAAMRPVGPDLGRQAIEIGSVAAVDPLAVRTGFGLTGALRSVHAETGGVAQVRATERDRLELRLNPTRRVEPGIAYAGYLVAGGRLRELPDGSSFDPDRGAFYWQPGLGYIGDYELLFVRTSADGTRERIPVKVTLEPRRPSLARPWLAFPVSN